MTSIGTTIRRHERMENDPNYRDKINKRNNENRSKRIKEINKRCKYKGCNKLISPNAEVCRTHVYEWIRERNRKKKRSKR